VRVGQTIESWLSPTATRIAGLDRAIVLSLASGGRPGTRMRISRNEPLLSLMITFGIQA
jgi:hypothetical protein